MMHAQRQRGVRLGVDFEAKALIANLGAEAYSAARLRATEASSEEMAKDWTNVASVIARRTRRFPFGRSSIDGAVAAPVGGDWPFT
jgi:hypothetical protein